MRLNTPLSAVLHTTKDHLKTLNEMGMKTVGDFLQYLPRAYEDLTAIQTLRTAPIDQKGTFRGTIHKLKRVRIRGGKSLVTGQFIDTEETQAEAVWFNQLHVLRMLKEGDPVVLTGKLMRNGTRLQIQSPQFESGVRDALVHAGRLVPIYPEHDLINTKWLREKMLLVREAIDNIKETLPKEVLEEEKLIGRKEAILALHFPDKGEEVERARQRIAFEEMYFMQCDVLQKKKEWKGERQERLKIPMDVELIRAFFESLNFTPTNSQKISIYEILKDMEEDHSMSRLLEGDVGSGKTLVAVTVLANVIRHGGQCALMVPTEVLARQHVSSIGKILINFHNYLEEHKIENLRMKHPSIALLTGSVPASEAQTIKNGLATGTIDLVIGTHSLIQETVQFHNLQLVIVDEQHRFGVSQREQLKEKGSPHFLSMTATPIPRTLALTSYGHHDLSVLTEKPGNRQPIKTKVVSPADRSQVEKFIDHQIDEGRQIFVICPLIQESENEDMVEMKSVEEEAKRLEQGFPHRRIAKLHGRMKPAEKEETMRLFKDKQSDILVSTSVIEVGIDVPNATIIVIEGAERFGLAQLHQFRGRVGRSDYKSHCFLFTTTPQQAKSPRLRAMEEYDSGFHLAEIDLQIRGPGELFGFRQSGLPDFRLGGLINPELIVRARRAAERELGIQEEKVALS